MTDDKKQSQEKQQIRDAVNAFGDFMSTIDELSKAQQELINQTNRQFELEKIETLRRQIQKGK